MLNPERTLFRPYYTVCGVFGYIAIILLWLTSVAFVFFHARRTNENQYLWGAIALLLPFVGVLIYYAHLRLRAISDRGLSGAGIRERTGERLVKPRTVEELLELDAVVILARYRDAQIERLILDKKMKDAMALIKNRVGEMSARGDRTAVETLNYYRHIIGEYKTTREFPEYFLNVVSEGGAGTGTDAKVNLADQSDEWVEDAIADEPGRPPFKAPEKKPDVDDDNQNWLEV